MLPNISGKQPYRLNMVSSYCRPLLIPVFSDGLICWKRSDRLYFLHQTALSYAKRLFWWFWIFLINARCCRNFRHSWQLSKIPKWTFMHKTKRKQCLHQPIKTEQSIPSVYIISNWYQKRSWSLNYITGIQSLEDSVQIPNSKWIALDWYNS